MQKLIPTQHEQTFMNSLLGGRYEVLEIIGRGIVGTVFSGNDSLLNRPVAVKLLRTTIDEKARERFSKEVEGISSLTHPNLVQLFEVGTQKGFTYLILEYVPGRTLRDILANGRLSVEATIELGICISSGLVEAHANHLIHRDLKPGNILVEQKGEHVSAKLNDFGIPFSLSSDGYRLNASGAMCGTPGYLAPEQVNGTTVTNKSDLYSLGLVLFECLTGNRALEGNHPVEILTRQRDQKKPSLKNYPSLEIPADFERLINNLISRTVQNRPESAKVVLNALKQILKTRTSYLSQQRKTRPLKSFSKTDLEESMSMPIREGGGWDELLAETPGIQENISIDPQLFDPHPNLIDISFEFDQRALLTEGPESLSNEQKKPTVKTKKQPQKRAEIKRDYAKLELEDVDRNVLPQKIRSQTKRSMPPWFQFMLVTMISMILTFGFIYCFTYRNTLVDRLSTAEKTFPHPKKDQKPTSSKSRK